jgi:hypothetical protein
MDDEGVRFPLIDGRRSTQQTSRDIFAGAAGICDADLASAISTERSWRTAYPTHLRDLTARAAVSPATGAAIARAGLDRVHATFEFGSAGATRSMGDAMASSTGPALRTRTVAGEGMATGLTVPYRGEVLQGEGLLAAAGEWQRRGVVEPAVVAALSRLVDHPEWFDLDGMWFAVLGAGAEMAPTERLLRWGADVVVVDVPNPGIWRHLEELATAGSGRLHVPVEDDGGPLGVDLVTGAPRIGAWLAAFDHPLVLGNYAYADAATFALVSVAADAVIASLRRQRDDHAVVCLATPTDAFAVSADVVAETRRRAGTVSAVAGRGQRRVTAGRLMVPSYRETVQTDDGREVGIADSLVLQQGPNYALAKRIQRWRAIVASADGAFGAVHVAPPTRTRSVLKNRVLAAAYAGASLFGVETFEPATSRALMAALLIHDLRVHTGAVMHDDQPADATDDARAGIGERHHGPVAEHDLTAAAVHGGLWRVPWETRTALPLAVLRGAPALLRSGARHR